MPGARPRPRSMRPGKQRLQHLEALRHHQRRVVRQHHAARADAHVRRDRRDLPDHDVGRGAGDVREIVVLGDPVALVAEPVGETRQIERVAQRHRARRGGGDGRQIEDGKRDHAGMFCFGLCRAHNSMRSRRAPPSTSRREFGRRSVGRGWHELAADALDRLADRLNRRTGGGGGVAAWRQGGWVAARTGRRFRLAG